MRRYRRRFDSTEIAPGQARPGIRTRQGRFVYSGTPICVVGAGMYGLRAYGHHAPLNVEAWDEHLERLAAIQTTHVRWRLRFNPWLFCFDRTGAAPAPWQGEPGNWNLSAFNNRFWDAVRHVVRTAERLGILVEFVLFDIRAFEPQRGGHGWALNPFRAENGGPITGSGVPALFNLAAPRNLALDLADPLPMPGQQAAAQAALQRYVRHAVEVLDDLPNVSWAIASRMDGSDPSRVAFALHFLQFLRTVDKLDRATSLSGVGPLRGDAVFFRLTGIDTVQFQYDEMACRNPERLRDVAWNLRAYGKPVFADRVGWNLAEPRAASCERAAIWEVHLAGGHASLADPTDLALRSAHTAVGAFARIVEEHCLWHATPRRECVVAAPEGVRATAAVDGDYGAIYLFTDAPCSGGMLRLRIPDGRWRVAFYDPQTAMECGAAAEVTAERDGVEIGLPAFAEDLVVTITWLEA